MILIDAHVHFYRRFEVTAMLDAALANFRANAQGAHFTGVLIHCARAGSLSFSELFERLPNDGEHRWNIRNLGQDNFMLDQGGRDRMLLACGHEIRTAEGLEVHSLFTKRAVPSGQSVLRTASASLEQGITVIPWAVGKMLGWRGKAVSRAIEKLHCARLLIGDNGGRPVFWPTPGIVRCARRLSLSVVRGSDPLPLRDEHFRVGSFGSRLNIDLDPRSPVDHLKRLLISQPFEPYGSLASLPVFTRTRLRFHWGRIAAANRTGVPRANT